MKIPIPILIADLIGTLLLALGLFRYFSQSQGNAPDWVGGTAIIWAIVVAGILFMLPMLIWLVTRRGH